MKEIEALRSLLAAGEALRQTAPVDDDFPAVMHSFDSALRLARNAPKDHQPLTIGNIASRQHDWVERMGWHNKTVLEALALIASEVGEAVNECRMRTPSEKFGEELADIILRTLDLSVTAGVDIEQAIIEKMAINELRGTRGRSV